MALQNQPPASNIRPKKKNRLPWPLIWTGILIVVFFAALGMRFLRDYPMWSIGLLTGICIIAGVISFRKVIDNKNQIDFTSKYIYLLGVATLYGIAASIILLTQFLVSYWYVFIGIALIIGLWFLPNKKNSKRKVWYFWPAHIVVVIAVVVAFFRADIIGLIPTNTSSVKTETSKVDQKNTETKDPVPAPQIAPPPAPPIVVVNPQTLNDSLLKSIDSLRTEVVNLRNIVDENLIKSSESKVAPAKEKRGTGLKTTQTNCNDCASKGKDSRGRPIYGPAVGGGCVKINYDLPPGGFQK